ncbi:MAG: HEAT repeat domain-containing protein [Anaerolineae bacterium]|nr:HEAT repeat domain-containing protein [Anaerolineae bacterium]
MPPFVGEAIQKLESTDEDVRRKTLETLASSDHPAALEALAINAIQHHLPDVRRNAGFLLAEKTNYQDTRALDGLIAAFDRKAFGSSESAAQIIKQYGQAGISTFIKLLDHPYGSYSSTRVIGVRSLGEMNAREVVPKLAEMLLNDVNDGVIQTILQVLHKLGDDSIVPSLKQRLAQVGNNQAVLFLIASLLVQFKDHSTVIPILIDLLKDSSYRDESSNLLLGIGHIAAPQITAAIESPYSSVRQRSIEVLMRMGYEGAIPMIIARIDDEDVLVRRAAIRALGHFKVTTLEDRLISLLSDNDVQIAAKSALWMLGTDRANAALAAFDSAFPGY